MSKIDDLKAELKSLQEKRETESEIVKLQKQIKAEKFSQTKTGKAVNFVGRVGGKILSPPKEVTGKKKKKPQPSVKDVLNNIDKAIGGF